MSDSDGLTKVLVDLPNGNAVGGESLWAVELGADRFELRNTPFHAYGLNFGDVVLARAERQGEKPRVLEVLKPSGHRTLRVFFLGSTSEDERLLHLGALGQFGVSYERANASLFALDLEPAGDMSGLRDALDDLERDGILGYETAESRSPGSFDDDPPS